MGKALTHLCTPNPFKLPDSISKPKSDASHPRSSGNVLDTQDGGYTIANAVAIRNASGGEAHEIIGASGTGAEARSAIGDTATSGRMNLRDAAQLFSRNLPKLERKLGTRSELSGADTQHAHGPSVRLWKP